MNRFATFWSIDVMGGAEAYLSLVMPIVNVNEADVAEELQRLAGFLEGAAEAAARQDRIHAAT